MYLVFTCMPGELSRRLGSFSCFCDIFWVLISSLVCWLHKHSGPRSVSDCTGNKTVNAAASFQTPTANPGNKTNSTFNTGDKTDCNNRTDSSGKTDCKPPNPQLVITLCDCSCNAPDPQLVITHWDCSCKTVMHQTLNWWSPTGTVMHQTLNWWSPTRTVMHQVLNWW